MFYTVGSAPFAPSDIQNCRTADMVQGVGLQPLTATKGDLFIVLTIRNNTQVHCSGTEVL